MDKIGMLLAAATKTATTTTTTPGSGSGSGSLFGGQLTGGQGTTITTDFNNFFASGPGKDLQAVAVLAGIFVIFVGVWMIAKNLMKGRGWSAIMDFVVMAVGASICFDLSLLANVVSVAQGIVTTVINGLSSL